MENWIDVKDRFPELIDDEYSEDVLCVGHKGTHPNDIYWTIYEVMNYKKLEPNERVLKDSRGNVIKYGWSNRWWDTNPDLYGITHWMTLPKPPVK